MDMEDVSDIEMELDKDETTVDDNKSEEKTNFEFEEEVIVKFKYLLLEWTIF